MSINIRNPYVGPRTFTREENDLFFGRDVEARDLLSLVISERLVLFYAQSGAGKSSLINTRLAPQLAAEGFLVLPIARISGELPAGIEQVDNIFVFNLLLSLDQSQQDPARFAHMNLTDFLTNLASTDGEHFYYDDAPHEETAHGDTTNDIGDAYEEPAHVLIIDQFEEIVTTHLDRWPERTGFFRQLNRAMLDDPLLWVVLTLREDQMAALDPYTPFLSNRLRDRFYMQRMGYEAALEAVRRPAEQAGRPFTSEAVETLVDNLRKIRVHGQAEAKTGQFIEPVQLQVVCYQLWKNLKGRPAGVITEQDLQEAGDVDTALAKFYEQAIQKSVQETGISEIELRNWFDERIITEAGTRGMVYQGTNNTAGLPNQVVKSLADQFLVRAEIRAGGTWYELVHDRFVEPIQKANQTWRKKTQTMTARRLWLFALLVIAASILIVVFQFAAFEDVTEGMDVGDYAPRSILAPLQFSYISDFRTEAERELARNSVSTFYALPDPKVVRQQVDLLRKIFDYLETIRADPYGSLAEKSEWIAAIPDLSLSDTVVDQILFMDSAKWAEIRQDALAVLNQAMQAEIKENQVLSTRRRLPTLVRLDTPDEYAAVIVDVTEDLIQPNTFPDEAQTEAERRAAVERVAPVKVIIEKNQVIVSAGQIVGPLEKENLGELQSILQPETSWYEDLVALFAPMIFVSVYLVRYTPQVLRDGKRLTLLVLLWLAFVVLAKLMIPNDVLTYLYPIAALTMITAIVIEMPLAFILATVLALYASYLVTDNAPAIVVYLIFSGWAGVLVLGKGQRVKDLLLAAVYMGIVNAGILFALNYSSLSGTRSLVVLLVPGLINGLISTILVLTCLFAIRSLIGFTGKPEQ